MAIQTQFRRGNSYSHSLFTGASGEITVDLDKKVAVVHDGATVGGFPLSLNAYTAAAYNQANTASTIAGLAFNAANVAAAFTVAGATGNISNIQLAAGITSSGLLTTANISELTNLYFTNARSRATISIASGNVNGKGSYDSATGVISINAANVTVSSSAPTDPYIGDVWIHADTAVEYLYFNDGTSFQWAEVSAAGTGGSSSNYGDSNVALLGYATNANVTLKANIADLKTANVAELTNLYFTNARVYSNVTQLGYITSASLSGYATNTQLGAYATNAQLTSYATTTNVALKANVIDLTTANVTEVTNLYFTNARAVAALTAGQSITIDANGRINSSATGGGSSTYGDSNVILLGYATNANVSLKANVVDLTTANVIENTNLYFTNVRVYSNVTQLGYITSASLSGYATNAQLGVYATNTQLGSYATNAQLGLYATNAQLASYATTTNVALKANVVDLTTANVTEVTNLYFTNARAIAAVTNTTLSNLTVSGNVSASNFVGNITITGNVVGTSANVSLVAGAYTATFDNTGNLTIPGNISATGTFVGSGSGLTGVAVRTTGTWTVATGTNTYSITVPINGAYQIWVRGNIPNGIISYIATVQVTNTNVPVLGTQRAWNYTDGGSPILITTMPTQIIGAEGTISTAVPATSNANRFDFVISNTSGSSQTASWGYITL